MDGRISVSTQGLLATGLVLLALLAAYLLGDSGGTTAEAAEEPAAPATAERTVTMDGLGEATAVPDQLGFTLSVNAARPALDLALDDTNATMRDVLARLGDLGVERSDVQTTGLSMNPVYDYHESGPPTLRGYRVSQRAQVLVSELKQGGAAITAAVESGGNGVRVADIRLSVADPDAVLAQARRAAVEEATDKAEEYAEATGQELGEVLTLREVSPAPAVDASRLEQAAELDGLASYAAGERAVPIRAGEDELTVRVEVIWRLAG